VRDAYIDLLCGRIQNEMTDAWTGGLALDVVTRVAEEAAVNWKPPFVSRKRKTKKEGVCGK
jgi:hypothetical protein